MIYGKDHADLRYPSPYLEDNWLISPERENAWNCRYCVAARMAFFWGEV